MNTTDEAASPPLGESLVPYAGIITIALARGIASMDARNKEERGIQRNMLEALEIIEQQFAPPPVEG